RVVVAPLPPAGYAKLQAGAAGQVYFLKAREVAMNEEELTSGGELHRYDIAKRKDEKLLDNLADYRLTPDGGKVLTHTAGDPGTWTIAETARPTDGKKLNLDAVEVRVDPPAEWAQILDEVWRINRDYFYAPNMHGADWPTMKTKYAEFLPHLATSADLYRVVRWMLSELAVGHSYTSPGERPQQPKRVPGGLLGADYE